MRQVINALSENGFKKNEIIKLIKVFPPILEKKTIALKGFFYFLKNQLSLNRVSFIFIYFLFYFCLFFVLFFVLFLFIFCFIFVYFLFYL
jgi:hypothetical protein